MDETFPAAQRIRIVLVGTQHPGNIGSAARAMKTMGLHRLALVAPERFPHPDAAALAAGAGDVLDAARVHATLADAVADCGHVIGCTARTRRIAMDEAGPRETATRVLAEAARGNEVALVFGRERTGLDNDELQLCHAAVTIPANPGYSSLNLAAAVQVLSYELRMSALADVTRTTEAVAADDLPASHAEMEGFFTQLGDTLDAIDFHKGRTPEAAMHKLRRVFLRAAPDAREVRLLRGVLADAQRMARLAGGQGGSGSQS
ncbi:RNA methyltransferase [Luteimonas aestuarii]|uniref:tRNA (cytidine/uridine-2'-O-)-methyltransferase TrmJ n=1 Tax=Luteimonas aestuarii TaxID=453837 RepID=A0A4R5TY42_9GAMM|nr:RNA methyltransferase [Luteimonas aestuarii]TDK26144.1 RNA methyltransferase [Luteimonas aestuarii]